MIIISSERNQCVRRVLPYVSWLALSQVTEDERSIAARIFEPVRSAGFIPIWALASGVINGLPLLPQLASRVFIAAMCAVQKDAEMGYKGAPKNDLKTFSFVVSNRRSTKDLFTEYVRTFQQGRGYPVSLIITRISIQLLLTWIL